MRDIMGDKIYIKVYKDDNVHENVAQQTIQQKQLESLHLP